MAIIPHYLHLISQSLKLKNFKGKTIYTLGVQECYFNENSILKYFHNDINSKIDDSRTIRNQSDLFKALGFKKILSIDFSSYEGAEIILDLNEPIDKKFNNTADIVFDSGTSEHIFDQKTHFNNLFNLVKKNGFIIHILPVDLIDHGFYNFNKELFDNLYLANNFKPIRSTYFYIKKSTVHNVSNSKHYYIFDETKKIPPYLWNYNCFYFGIFKKDKINNRNRFTIPIQSFYSNKEYEKGNDKNIIKIILNQFYTIKIILINIYKRRSLTKVKFD